ncbi:MAG: diaminopimelate epimerase [Deltaproteobacteria bacterium]|jgi:diaminopimelate epimerase|nr:diaminopimelate epimerase [Deltaproteobacteria bacterium]
MHLIRSHGLGNDYLVLTSGEPMSPARAQALCDRHRGVGSDGVLEPVLTDDTAHGLRIWNPDGSLAEKSGNGLRIFGWFLHCHRSAGTELQVRLYAPGPVGEARCRVWPEEGEVEVEMGVASLDAATLPAAGPLDRTPLPLGPGGPALPCTAISMGNPHCVIFAEDLPASWAEPGTGPLLDRLPWRSWGPRLEAHPHFPRRTNVQFAQVVGENVVAARIWERGAGETLASGSSACAVAVAAVRHRRLAAQPDAAGWVHVRVEMPGGALAVAVGPGLAVRQRGPVEELAAIETRWPVPA